MKLEVLKPAHEKRSVLPERVTLDDAHIQALARTATGNNIVVAQPTFDVPPTGLVKVVSKPQS